MIWMLTLEITSTCTQTLTFSSPVPHDNFDAGKWVEEFVTRLQDGLSTLNEDDDDGMNQKQLPDSLPKNEAKVTPPRSPQLNSSRLTSRNG